MGGDRSILLHCEERLRRIRKYSEGGRAAFMASRVHQDAVLWNLQMICVCGRSVSDEERQRHPHIDWNVLCNLCDGLVNGELAVDPERVWKVVESSVPLLQHHLRLLLTAKV
jgi:uncharacterized protein with HEPN domain